MDPETLIAIPLHTQLDTLCGLVNSIRKSLTVDTGSLSRSQIDAGLKELSRQLTIIAKKVGVQEEEQENLLALTDITQIINSSLDLDDVLRIVMDNIIRLSGAERGFLMLSNRQGEMEIQIARNWEQEAVPDTDYAISHSIINRVVADGQPLLTTNALEDPRFDAQESIIIFNLRSIMCVPLKVKDSLTGVIYVDNRIKAGMFTERGMETLATFANQAAIAIENARLFSSVRQTLSEVTELKNLMDNIFASIASGVITTDISDQITLCNRAASRILGRASTDLVGGPFSDQLAPLATSLAAQIRRVLYQDQHLVGQEVQLDLPNRGTVDLSLNISPLKNAEAETQGLAIIVDDLTDKKRLEAQRAMFGRMVSNRVIEHLNPNALQLGGTRLEITTLFADIRGFTSFSETIDPQVLIAVLNRYLSAAVEAVLGQEGTIDKFMGDAIMAWFNAPIAQPDHQQRAVLAALAFKDAVLELHNTLPPKQRLNFGVGVHFGEAVVGLVGSETRLEYTAIGDSINTAKRIQENSQPNQILISQTVHRMVRDLVITRPVSPIHAKGKRDPVIVYEVLDRK